MRAVLVGYNWGARMHVRVLRQTGWDIHAIVGRDRERTELAASELNVARTSTCISNLDQSNIDLIVLAVPWRVHANLLADALKTNAIILTEHPLSPQICEARQIVEAAAGRSKPVLVNFATRFLPVVTELRQAIANLPPSTGTYVDHRLTFPLDEEMDWLPILTSHCLDTARHLLGKLTLRKANLDQVIRRPVRDCPSWSWPMIQKGVEETSIVAASGTWKASFAGGSYNFEIRQADVSEFTEQMELRCGDYGFAYELRLARSDESSPWRASALWRGPSWAQPVFSYPKSNGAESDSWLVAHEQQAHALTVAFNYCQPFQLASASDAFEIQSMVDYAVNSSLLGGR
ncbi:Gfo/Idh/MocA family protein [Sinorhizobium meliloti]|uniref:Gfo/Idh/MocA family protein n=1 Tax=Rhizobium meliloti TaxID=382 RepID=UPI000FDAC770|nr:Gfo/Idh/MocA family oxidoreductase [Sinorhizobium meliloti]RVE87069.1 gfo/Idh/MocA family oxidoreductase [Sinorhizobium meliloti]